MQLSWLVALANKALQHRSAKCETLSGTEKRKSKYVLPFELPKTTLSAQYVLHANDVFAAIHQPALTPGTISVVNRHQPVKIFSGVLANLSGIAENFHDNYHMRFLHCG